MSHSQGEHNIARITPDGRVGAINAGLELLGLFALMATINLAIGASGAATRSFAGALLSGGVIVAPFFWAWRAKRKQSWMLTTRRLLCNGRTEVALADIRRIRVWPTSVWLYRRTAPKVVLGDLVDSAAVARLIQETISANRGHA